VALTAQALIIVAGVVKLVPLTGITLPLLSHGGSSMLVSALSAGLLLAVDAEGRT
jgi:cell division protein FtsW (lipid II flippase)